MRAVLAPRTPLSPRPWRVSRAPAYRIAAVSVSPRPYDIGPSQPQMVMLGAHVGNVPTLGIVTSSDVPLLLRRPSGGSRPGNLLVAGCAVWALRFRSRDLAWWVPPSSCENSEWGFRVCADEITILALRCDRGSECVRGPNAVGFLGIMGA
jgi:hypothetical protein